jgi:DNA-directed RNA polymerase subunit beta
MQSLCLDVEVLSEGGEGIELKEAEDDIFKTAEELGLDLSGIGGADSKEAAELLGSEEDITAGVAAEDAE